MGFERIQPAASGPNELFSAASICVAGESAAVLLKNQLRMLEIIHGSKHFLSIDTVCRWSSAPIPWACPPDYR